MKSHDELVDEDQAWCFAKPGEVYAVFVFGGKTTQIVLPEGSYEVHWFDPHRGGELMAGNALQGPGRVSLGEPPDGITHDWVCLVHAKKKLRRAAGKNIPRFVAGFARSLPFF